jgi:CubicO group peptidase (beta-lactamase class C family)
MATLEELVDATALERAFSGVVRVDRRGTTEFAKAYGYADRAFGIANTVETRFAIASGTKTFTALTVMALVEDGALDLTTNARSVLGDDLPEIADDVTIEHLLAHRSGIGDYLDESQIKDINDYVLRVPVHQLATTEQFLGVLDGFPTVFPAGKRFAYNNGGYVVLALIAERAGRAGYHELVRRHVFEPAGMRDTAFLRSDELPGRAARGYLNVDGLRTNVLHLPVVGTGDGGAYSTAADLHRFWEAVFAGRIVSPNAVALMLRPHSDWPEESKRYGLGFHLHETGPGVWLEGYDAGVSFSSLHQPSLGITYTVCSNWSDGAWPVIQLLAEQLGT